MFASILLLSALSIEHFPRRAEGKVNVRSDFAAFRRVHRALFLDRQKEKPIASARQVHETAFSWTGRGKSPSQAHAKTMIRPFPGQAGGKADRKQHSNRLFLHRQGEITFYDVLRPFSSKREI